MGAFEFTGNVKLHGDLFVNGSVGYNEYADLSLVAEKLAYNSCSVPYFGSFYGADFTNGGSSGWVNAGEVSVAAPPGSMGVLIIHWLGGYSSSGGTLTNPSLYYRNWRIVDNHGNVFTQVTRSGAFAFQNNAVIWIYNSITKGIPGLTDRTFYLQVEGVHEGGPQGSHRVRVLPGYIECLVRKR